VITFVAVLSSLVGAAAGWVGGSARLAEPSRIAVWTDRGEEPYASGEAAHVLFRSAADAYVTILRVDTDGRVQVLFPREPWQDNFVRGGREYAITGSHGAVAFSVDDYPGVGYLFAVAAPDPFVYAAIARGDHWDYRGIADGRVRGDPYVALTELAQRIVPDGYPYWDYDIVPYYVERHYDYPRFLCYDCHSYVSYPFWRPYDFSCPRFRIVTYDDPDYYPSRYSGGAPVVVSRSLRPEPRFVFTDRQGAEPFVTRVRGRAVTAARPPDIAPRGRDGDAGLRPPSPGGRPTPAAGAADRRNRDRRDDRPGARPVPRDGPDRQERPGRGDTRRRPPGSERPVRPPRPPRAEAPGPGVAPDAGRRPSEPPPPRPEPRRESGPASRPPAAASPTPSRGESPHAPRRDTSRPSRDKPAPKPRQP
jgi:Domain of unknown function (DUF4384)